MSDFQDLICFVLFCKKGKKLRHHIKSNFKTKTQNEKKKEIKSSFAESRQFINRTQSVRVH